MAFKQTRKHEAWVWSFFFFIQSLKRKLWVFKEGFFQVIHFIVVADERASNRAVANVLRLSCLARDFLLSPFFFLFLPLALSFWYWCLQLHSWTAVHNSTDPSFSRVTQSARVRGHTRGDWFKVQIASERIQSRAGRKKVSASKHPVQHVSVVFHPYLGKSWAGMFQLDSLLALLCVLCVPSYILCHLPE